MAVYTAAVVALVTRCAEPSRTSTIKTSVAGCIQNSHAMGDAGECNERESSESPSTKQFVDSCLQKIDQTRLNVACNTFTCVGGTWLGWFGDSSYEPCMKKKVGQGIRHARSQVCEFHHDFIKCEGCGVHVHEGCHVPSPSGYSLPKRGSPWRCIQCTRTPAAVADALTQDVADALTQDVTTASHEEDSLKTKCIFSNKQLLAQHMRDMRWRIRSGGGSTAKRLYFDCSVGKCKTHFACKSLDNDLENGEWCAINMPSAHECRDTKSVALPVTTRVCNLPLVVFQDIQRLACSKAFLTVNIQTYIKHLYNGLVVDTALIYNIGYRARQKLGIGDMEQLYAHQRVTVYIFSPLYTLT